MKFNLDMPDITFDVGDYVWIRYGINSNNGRNWRKVQIIKVNFWADRHNRTEKDVFINVTYDVTWPGKINPETGKQKYEFRKNVPFYVVSGDDGDGPALYRKKISDTKAKIARLQKELAELEGVKQ